MMIPRHTEVFVSRRSVEELSGAEILMETDQCCRQQGSVHLCVARESALVAELPAKRGYYLIDGV